MLYVDMLLSTNVDSVFGNFKYLKEYLITKSLDNMNGVLCITSVELPMVNVLPEAKVDHH